MKLKEFNQVKKELELMYLTDIGANRLINSMGGQEAEVNEGFWRTLALGFWKQKRLDEDTLFVYREGRGPKCDTVNDEYPNKEALDAFFKYIRGLDFIL